MTVAAFIVTLALGNLSPTDTQTGVSADAALIRLKEGHSRFLSGRAQHPHADANRLMETAKGQKPFVTILSCSDSRVPPEVLFDQGVGDLFVVRVAGNVAGPSELGTIEYGAGHLGTGLIVVLGHTKCGAVTAAAQNAEVHGHIPKLLANIAPAVARTRREHPGCGGDELVSHAIDANVWTSIETIVQKSDEIRHLALEGKVQMVGAIYDVTSGELRWLGEHPRIGEMVSHVQVHGRAATHAVAGGHGHGHDLGVVAQPTAGHHAPTHGVLKAAHIAPAAKPRATAHGATRKRRTTAHRKPTAHRPAHASVKPTAKKPTSAKPAAHKPAAHGDAHGHGGHH